MMKPVSTAMTLALLAAGLTPVIVKVWIEGPAHPIVAKSSPSIQVLVMARDVPTGTKLQADDFRYEYWPVMLASKTLVRKSGNGINAKTPFIGQTASCDLFEGEPFDPAHCLGPQQALQ